MIEAGTKCRSRSEAGQRVHGRQRCAWLLACYSVALPLDYAEHPEKVWP